MASRYRGNFLYGTLSGFNTSQTTFTGTGFPTNLTTGTYLPIIINPGYNGATASSEIVYVTGITGAGTVITVSGRGFEGTTATSGSTGDQWVSGPLASDFGISNQIANGDFPTPASGQLLVATSASGVTFTNSGLTISGSTIKNSTIGSGNVVSPSAITSGTLGQIMVTTNSGAGWVSINNNYAGPGGASTTTFAGTNGGTAISIAVSGNNFYQVYTRCNLYSASSFAVIAGLTIYASISTYFGGTLFPLGPSSVGQIQASGVANGQSYEFSNFATLSMPAYSSSSSTVVNFYCIVDVEDSSGRPIGYSRGIVNVTGIG
jgi:hypothetical protein